MDGPGGNLFVDGIGSSKWTGPSGPGDSGLVSQSS